MARVTVEDCMGVVGNRFELVLAAASRARRLSNGAAEPCVPWENDKSTVVALREAANNYIDKDGEVVNKAAEDAEVVVSVTSALDDLVDDDDKDEG